MSQKYFVVLTSNDGNEECQEFTLVTIASNFFLNAWVSNKYSQGTLKNTSGKVFGSF